MNNKLIKDRYYVTQGTVHGIERSFPINYIFKQRIDSRCLEPYLDIKGSTTNGWGVMKLTPYKDNGFNSWVREATEYEIQEYTKNNNKPCLSKYANIETIKDRLKKLRI